MIYRVDPKTWTVEHMFPTVGFRPHGIGIETDAREYLWESDTNMGAFFKRDMVTGEVVDAIVLPGRLAVSARHVGLARVHLLGRRHRRRQRACVPLQDLKTHKGYRRSRGRG